MKEEQRARRLGRWIVAAVLAGVLPSLTGCVTVAEFRKLERQVHDMQRGGTGGGEGRTRVADLATQIRDLEATIAQVPCDVVVVGTPIDLGRLIEIKQPVVRARYELQEIGQPDLARIVDDFLVRLAARDPSR